MFSIKKTTRLCPKWIRFARMYSPTGSGVPGDAGSGVGKGGGGGGAIRDAGGSFGKMQVANEEEYFYKQQKEQLQGLKVDKQNEGKSQGDAKKFGQTNS